MANGKIPIMMDVDTGVDDAVAMMLALASEELDVRGITAVAGNVPLAHTLPNTLAVVEYLGRPDIPVAGGAAKPLYNDKHDYANVHGKSGLGTAELPTPKKQAEDCDAVTLMERVLTESDEPVTLVPVGPLTNIAVLLLSRPHLKEKIRQIVLMGGAAYGGNSTLAAEFNIWVDAEAAHIVFASGIPLVMCGLDVTMKALATREDIDAFAALGTRAGTFCADVFEHYYNGYMNSPLIKNRPKGEVRGCGVHDAVAVTWLVKPEIITTRPAHVTVDVSGEYTYGCTNVNFEYERRGFAANCEVCMDIDRTAFIQNLLAAAAKGETA